MGSLQLSEGFIVLCPAPVVLLLCVNCFYFIYVVEYHSLV